MNGPSARPPSVDRPASVGGDHEAEERRALPEHGAAPPPPLVDEGEPMGPSEREVVLVNVATSLSRKALPRRLSRAGKALYAASALAVLIADVDLLLLTLLPVVTLGSMLLFFLSYVIGLTTITHVARVRVTAAGVTVERQGQVTTLASADIAAAMVVRAPVKSPLGTLVPGAWLYDLDVDLRGGDRLRVRVRDEAEALAAVEVLGFGPGGRPLDLEVAVPTRRLLHLPLALAAHLIASIATAVVAMATDAVGVIAGLGPLFTVIFYELLKRGTRAPSVRVGGDAVLLRGAGRQLLALDPAWLRRRLNGLGVDIPRREAVVQVVEERRARGGVAVDRYAQYARESSLPVAAWRTALAHGASPGYREAAASVDEAAAVLASSAATPEQRVGAAIRLRASGEPPARIRVVAEGLVDDDVREALEVVASDGDDAALERAVSRLRRT